MSAVHEAATRPPPPDPGFSPLHDRLLILPDKVSDKTAGGILIPRSIVSERQKKATLGVVCALGPGMLRYDGRRWPMPDGITVGSRVHFVAEGAIPVEIDGVKYLSVRDDFVLAEDLP